MVVRHRMMGCGRSWGQTAAMARDTGGHVIEGLGRSSTDVVVRDGCIRWHASSECEVRDAREGGYAYRCSLGDAYGSQLLPCATCATRLEALARTAWGPRTVAERARLALPRLQDLDTLVTIVSGQGTTTSLPRVWPPMLARWASAVSASG